MIQETVSRLLDAHDLSRAEAHEAMNEIMRGDATQAQIAGFLVALRAKGETADEIAGCAEAMREHVLHVRPQRTDLVDIVGTGGDGANTYNISTAAALVAAAGGAAIAKHGNRAASSASGSADVLEALGFRLDLPPERIERSIDELGFGFLFAQAHHPAMRHAAPVRRELATRTVFNVLGPLTNPAGARALMLGVYSPGLTRTLAEALVQLGASRAYVVHGAGGIDELSPCGPNLVCEVENGAVREYELDPRDLGVERCDPAELRGGDPQTQRTGAPGGAGGRAAAATARRCSSTRPAGSPPPARAQDLREGLEVARGRSTPAPRRSGSTSSSRSHAGGRRLMGRFPDALAAARALGDRRVQAALAVGGRHPPRRAHRGDRAAATRRPARAAISVLVDERFGGTIDDLVAARAATNTPLLAKGFFSTEEHLLELRDAGADAVLLILRDLDDATTARLLARAHELGLDALVEAHNANELERAMALQAPIVGVNARDLSTFRIDRKQQLALVARAARDKNTVVIAESGIHTRAQGAAAELAGADAVLVGYVADAGARIRARSCAS